MRHSVLDVQLGTTVALALAARQRLRGRLQRTALAVTVRTRPDAQRRCRCWSGSRTPPSATLRQRLVVAHRYRTGRCGRPLRRAAPGNASGSRRLRSGSPSRPDAGSTCRSRSSRPSGRSTPAPGSRPDRWSGQPANRALVVAVVDAVTVVIQVRAARRHRGRSDRSHRRPGPAGSPRRPRPARRRTSLPAERIDALVVEVGAVGQFGAQRRRAPRSPCRPTPSLAARLPSSRSPGEFGLGKASNSSSDRW